MNAAKLVRFAAVLTVLAGYIFVFRTGQGRIDERLAENARLAEEIAAAERTLASRHVLEVERARLSAAVRGAPIEGDRGSQVARFLRDAARTASAHRTAIASVVVSTTPALRLPLPGGASPTSANAATTDAGTAADPFETTELEVTMEGRYDDVLAAVRAIPRSAVLTSVEVASLARKNADSPDTTLTTVLHVVLHRFAPQPPRVVPAGTPRSGDSSDDVRARRA